MTGSRPGRYLPVARTLKRNRPDRWSGYFRVIQENVAPNTGDPAESRKKLAENKFPSAAFLPCK
jgi:hypothetical protein